MPSLTLLCREPLKTFIATRLDPLFDSLEILSEKVKGSSNADLKSEPSKTLIRTRIDPLFDL